MPSKAENITQFISKKLGTPANGPSPDHPGFNIFDIEQRMITGATSPTFVRRDFYKIMLYRGQNSFHYGDQSIPVNGTTLLFFNPRDPYTYDPLQKGTTGFFCVFKNDFMKEFLRLRIEDHPLFVAGSRPVFSLDKAQEAEVSALFQRMQRETISDFPYKYDLIRSYVLELIYLGLKLSPATSHKENTNASTRIATVFMELLERQFPIENTSQRYDLRFPKDFADRLSLHVNYLNRVIKTVTGKTTTEQIATRLIAEAKALLRHTSWSISEIAYSLGFEEPAHFTNFFKKHTHKNPHTYRQV